MSAQAIQLIKNQNGQPMTLNRSELETILMTDEIKDRFVCVISIAGAFRKGKSFMLNFFLRYIYAKYVKCDVSNWLKDETNSSNPLNGFSWRLGTEPETTGILMWSDVFLHDYENGEKVAIILLDTQGAFDHQSSVRDCASIFALSTMVSSVQIFNISQQIQENDLQHLELFVNYGKMAMEKCNIKPFQHLVFLIRDWYNFTEFEYGKKGGSRYLKKVLEVNDTQQTQLQSVRNNINECFMETKCFLMPHPGLEVASDPNFVGNLKDIKKDFQDYLLELIPSLLSPNNLIIKKINGEKIRAKEWINYLNSYTDIFNGDTLPEPKSIFMATAEVHNMTILSNAKTSYTTLMDLICGTECPYITDEDLEAQHLNAKNIVLLEFDSNPQLGGSAMTSKYRNEVDVYVNTHYENLKALNKSKLMEQTEKLTRLVDDCKQKYLNNMKAVCKKYTKNLKDLDNKAKNEAINQFNSNSDFGHIPLVDTYREKLLQYINGEYANFQKLNEGNESKLEIAFLKAVNNAKAFYNQRMENVCKNYIEDIKTSHKQIKKEALSKFNETSNLDNEEFHKMNYDQLNAYIENQYKFFNNLNNEKHTHIINKIKGDCIQMELSYTNSMNTKLQNSNMSDNDLLSIHNSTMDSVVSEFKTKWQTDHGQLFEEYVIKLKATLLKKFDDIKSAYVRNRIVAVPAVPAGTGKAVGSVGKLAGAVVGGTTGTIAGGVSGLGTGVASGFWNGMTKTYEGTTNSLGDGFFGQATGFLTGLAGGIGGAVVGAVVGTGTGVIQGANSGIENGIKVVDSLTNDDDLATNSIGSVIGTAGSSLVGIGAGICEGASSANNMVTSFFEDKECDDLQKQVEKTKKSVDSIFNFF